MPGFGEGGKWGRHFEELYVKLVIGVVCWTTSLRRCDGIGVLNAE